jgi:hypothetical protein
MTPINGSHYGAAPEAWIAFERLGLTKDLLPVVSNPSVPKSPKSKLAALGKVPSTINRAGEAVGIAAWTQRSTTASEVAVWSRNPDLGVCVQTRTVRAIDADIADPDAAERIFDMVDQLIGPLPKRTRSNSGKFLLAFRMPGEYRKRVIHTEHGNIEFLAGGQQFIAAGTHTSGVPYEWEGGLPDTIPDVTPAEFELVWAGLRKHYGVDSSAERPSVRPSVARAAGDAVDGMPDWLGETGWALSYEPSGVVHIRCPFEGEHTSPSSETATSYFPAGVGGFGRGHFKCLHAHCAGRTDQDFLDAMGLTVASEFTPADPVAEAPATPVGEIEDEFPAPGPLPPLTRGRTGTPQPTVVNAQALVVRADLLRARLGYDTFRDTVMIAQPGDKSWRALRDTDYFTLAGGFEALGVNLPTERVRAAVLWAAWENRFDSAQQWAKSLNWDGVPRVAGFLARYMGCEDSFYHRAVSMYLWTALAGRCLDPGCQADMVPVFVSKQGTGKTSLVEALAPHPDMFAEVSLEHRDVDLARTLRGKLVAEISELRGLAGRESEAIRAWITRKMEEWIPKYQEFATKYPRRFLPIGTANNEEFLADDEGERRWLPVRVGATDKAAIKADVQQLWAEGIARWEAGGVHWEAAEELAREVHAEFKVRDEWELVIEAWLAQDAMDSGGGGAPRGDGYVRILDVLVSAIGMNVREITRRDELRVGRALRHLGYEKRVVRVGNKLGKYWVGPKLAASFG